MGQLTLLSGFLAEFRGLRPSLSDDLLPCTGYYKLILFLLTLYSGSATTVR